LRPESHLACDDDAVAGALERLLGHFFTAGGWLAQGARVCCRDGALSIESARKAGQGGDLILLPKAGLLPVNQAQTRLEGNELVLAGLPSYWSSQQRALFEGMLEVYNLTGKIAAERQASAILGLAREPELAARFQPLFACRRNLQRDLERARSGDPELVVESFFHSRFLGFDDPMSAPSGREQVIMPVIDFLNHHFDGAGFETRHDERRGVHLAVRQWRPEGGERQCFVRYGHYDALDMLLSYGYVDHTAPFVRSLPVSLELPPIGAVAVRSLPFIHRGELPAALQGLRFHLPAIRREEDGGFTLSHLLIPTGQASSALRSVLRHVLRQVAPRLRPLQAMQAVKQAEAQLLEHNRRFYEALEAWVEGSRPDSRWLARVGELARVQLEKLESYRRPGGE